MKILIIKLGALGDVVRTLPLAKAIKKKFPDSELNWVTKKNALELFEGLPYIDKVFAISKRIEEKYDFLYNFDIDKEATDIASSVEADKKFGFYMDGGYIYSFNLGSEYYLSTLFDDNIKKNNRKTYQEMMFNVAEIPYNNEHSTINLDERSLEYAQRFVKENSLLTERLVGIHIGASSRWPSKVWAKSKVKQLIKKLKKRGDSVLLFGGPNEVARQKELVLELKEEGINVCKNNPNNSIKEFASLVNLCKIMVCSDSFALHISLALKKPTIGLFFCNSPWEVEDYGLLKKIVSPMLEEFFPEKMDQYSEELVNSISSEEVLSAIIDKRRV